MKFNHYTVLAMISILLTIAGLSWLSYTIAEKGFRFCYMDESF